MKKISCKHNTKKKMVTFLSLHVHLYKVNCSPSASYSKVHPLLAKLHFCHQNIIFHSKTCKFLLQSHLVHTPVALICWNESQGNITNNQSNQSTWLKQKIRSSMRNEYFFVRIENKFVVNHGERTFIQRKTFLSENICQFQNCIRTKIGKSFQLADNSKNSSTFHTYWSNRENFNKKWTEKSFLDICFHSIWFYRHKSYAVFPLFFLQISKRQNWKPCDTCKAAKSCPPL